MTRTKFQTVCVCNKCFIQHIAPKNRYEFQSLIRACALSFSRLCATFCFAQFQATTTQGAPKCLCKSSGSLHSSGNLFSVCKLLKEHLSSQLLCSPKEICHRHSLRLLPSIAPSNLSVPHHNEDASNCLLNLRRV